MANKIVDGGVSTCCEKGVTIQKCLNTCCEDIISGEESDQNQENSEKFYVRLWVETLFSKYILNSIT